MVRPLTGEERKRNIYIYSLNFTDLKDCRFKKNKKHACHGNTSWRFTVIADFTTNYKINFLLSEVVKAHSNEKGRFFYSC